MNWGLVIHENGDVRALLAALLKPVVPATLIEAATLAQARCAMKEFGCAHCCLIISSENVPLDAGQALSMDHRGSGLIAFLSEVRMAKAGLPCIVLGSLRDGDRGELFPALGNVETASVHEATRIAALARQMATGLPQPSNSLAPAVDVDIYLTDSTDGHWRIRGNPGNPIDLAGVIKIGWRERERLLIGSRGAEEARSATILQLGRDMYEHLVAPPSNCGLELALAGCNRPPGSLDGLRFRFHVDEESSAIAVETMALPSKREYGAQSELLMLHAPIFRKFGNRGGRHPLFKDKRSRSEPVACLIIQGETRRFNAGGALAREFPATPAAAAETDWLEHYLGENRQRFNLGVPRVLRPSGDVRDAYGQQVRGALSERPWQLIHYVGHSGMGADGEGYLVLGDDVDDLIAIDDFAARAKHTQFMFLNSCVSADARCILKLLERDIPAVAGFGWKIGDQAAQTFARTFYQELFDGVVSKRFLEYSFMRARAHLYEHVVGRAAWVAPQLYMQSAAAERGD